MSIIGYPSVRELLTSRSITRTSQGSEETREFDVFHTDPEVMLASGYLPAHGDPHPFLGRMYVDRLDVEPPAKDARWSRVRIYYKEWPLGLTPWAENWVWGIGSQQTNIQSVPNGAYIAHYPPGLDAGGAIRATAEGTEGVDVYRPFNTLKVTKLYAGIGMWDREFLERMTTTVNADYWHGYFPGEVLFLGADISRTDTGQIQIDFNFQISRWQPEGISIDLVDVDTGVVSSYVIYPSPFDYVWYDFEDEATDVSATSKTVKRQIKAIHIAQLYERTNFYEFNLAGPYG